MEKVKVSTTKHCGYLRARNHFGVDEGGENPWYDIYDSNTICVCVKTMAPAGPDNSLVDVAFCREGRTCYVEPQD